MSPDDRYLTIACCSNSSSGSWSTKCHPSTKHKIITLYKQESQNQPYKPITVYKFATVACISTQSRQQTTCICLKFRTSKKCTTTTVHNRAAGRTTYTTHNDSTAPAITTQTTAEQMQHSALLKATGRQARTPPGRQGRKCP